MADAFIVVRSLPGQPHLLRVRARRSEHIEALFPDVMIYEMSPYDRGGYDRTADYLFQANVNKDELKRVMIERIDSVSHKSFREDIVDSNYYDATTRARRHLSSIEPGNIHDFLNDPEWQ